MFDFVFQTVQLPVLELVVLCLLMILFSARLKERQMNRWLDSVLDLASYSTEDLVILDEAVHRQLDAREASERRSKPQLVDISLFDCSACPQNSSSDSHDGLDEMGGQMTGMSKEDKS